MKKRNSFNLLPLLSMVVIAAGLITSVSLAGQPQSLKSSAAGYVVKPPYEITPIPIQCKCTGTAACANLVTPARCSTNSSCKWICNSDQTPAPVKPSATMITPNGGEVYERGKTYTVSWTQNVPSAWTHITAYTRNSSGVYTPIGAIEMYVSTTAGTHSYSWLVGQAGTPSWNMPDGTNYYAAVDLYDSSGKLFFSDKSNAAFTIRSTVSSATMITPNGGEVYERGKTYTVSWTQNVPSAWTHITAYTRNSSGVYTPIGAIEMYVSTTAGTHSYSWLVGQAGTPSWNMPDGTNYYAAVDLYDSSGKLFFSDKSNAAFSITSPAPAITIPNGGETWQRGSTYQITWNQKEKLAQTALFLYTRSTAGDTYLGAIAYNVSNAVGSNSYSWTIPPAGGALTSPPDSANVIVSVAQYDANGTRVYEDKSDNTFTVITPKPAMITPNGGETWQRGSTYQITWNQKEKLASTALFVYTRGTASDTYLGAIQYNVSNVVGTNSYSWTIPATGSVFTTPPDGSNIILSVAQYDASGSRVYEDKSDAPFTVVTK